MDFYARKSSDGMRFQTVFDHLNNVASLAESFGRKFGFAKTAKLAALYHDAGKLSAAFSDYLLLDKGRRGEIIHSKQGAKIINEYGNGGSRAVQTAALIAALAVAGHHGGLSDAITPDGFTPLLTGLEKNDSSLQYDEVFKNYNTLFHEIPTTVTDCGNEVNTFFEKSQKIRSFCAFNLHLITKLVFSALVDADRYDSYLFEAGVTAEKSSMPDWFSLSENLEKSLENLNSDSEINLIRKNVSDECKYAAERDQGTFKLEVPTGGGKTLSGLRFALAHAKKHCLQHIIYVIPYLSILEQTADEIRKKLCIDADSDILLEHHSNIISTDENEEKHRLLTSRWDSPIIVTTMVQFLESVFSHKSGDLRKFHNMTKSVIIFDEIQNLPVKCVYLYNEAINFLTAFCRDTVLLCSATQPVLDKIKAHNIKLYTAPLLINSNTSDSFTVLKRTEVLYSGETDSAGVADMAVNFFEKGESCLVIVNTKKCAENIFRNLKKYSVHAYHLSTNMCREHRVNVINSVKCDLSENVPLICVSTQLIEAGVDISLGCVIRSLAGLDSIAQAAGRCNRSGEYGETKPVYVVKLLDENLSKLPDIKIGAEISDRIFREIHDGDIETDDPFSKTALDTYYHRFFTERESEFGYPIKGKDSIFGLLSLNIGGKNALIENKLQMPVLPFAFETAGKAFSVIEHSTTDVIAEGYNDASRKLVTEYLTAPINSKRGLLKRLGKYAVSMWSYEQDEHAKKGALSETDDGLLILADGFYDNYGDLEFGIMFHGFDYPDVTGRAFA
jgi:CRISPR-associated endonuclease/helicase Cas3